VQLNKGHFSLGTEERLKAFSEKFMLHVQREKKLAVWHFLFGIINGLAIFLERNDPATGSTY